MSDSSHHEPTTAAELMAELANDPEYQAAFAEQERAREHGQRFLAAAEAPLVADLQGVGVEVESIWELVNTAQPYPDALPVLVEHLGRDYPPKVTAGIARALAVKPATFAWPVLVEKYRAENDEFARQGLSAALSATATPETEEELVGLIKDESQGESRVLMLDSLARLGTERARSVLQGLTTDATLGQEARRIVAGRRHN